MNSITIEYNHASLFLGGPMKKIISMFSLCASITILQADTRIIMYLSHAPDSVLTEVEKEATQQGLAEKIASLETKEPGQISQKMVKYALNRYTKPVLSGFQTWYAGYSDISNNDGLISFPLRHATPKVYIAITPTIDLKMVKGHTASNQEFISTKPEDVALYSLTLKQDEKQNSFWEVIQEQVPENKKINPLTIVILTKPKNILIPTGHFWTQINQQLILPSVYVLARSENEELLLKSLDMGRYFENIMTDEKKVSEFSTQTMITNL